MVASGLWDIPRLNVLDKNGRREFDFLEPLAKLPKWSRERGAEIQKLLDRLPWSKSKLYRELAYHKAAKRGVSFTEYVLKVEKGGGGGNILSGAEKKERIRAQERERYRKRRANASQEELAELRRRKAESQRKWRANLSEEVKDRIRKSNREYKRKSRQRMEPKLLHTQS